MEQAFSNLKKYPTIGVCGLDCGMCPRFYTKGDSKCPGCGGLEFSQKHPSCSFITCCVKKHNLEVCSECLDFPCSKFKNEEEYQQMEGSSSYPPYKKLFVNLKFIKEKGIECFIEEQNKRINLLETMIKNFDDGKSKSFYCKASALMELKSLEEALETTIKQMKQSNIFSNDKKLVAKMLKENLIASDIPKETK